MTELQMGLIGLGVVAVAGVLVYNKWQEMRQRRQAEGMLKNSLPDVLLDGSSAPGESAGGRAKKTDVSPAAPSSSFDPLLADERVEPVLRSEPALDEPESSPLPPPISPLSETTAAVAPAPMTPVAPRAASQAGPGADEASLLSPRIDFIIAIDTVEPVSPQAIIDSSKETLARLRKPVRWLGYDENLGEWRSLSRQQDGEYRHVKAGLQLVDRRGPVNEADLAIFAAAMQELADQLTGIAEIPSRQSAFEAAAELDRFCAGIDIQVGINVISQGQAFAGTKLRALAEAAGMAIDEGGRFVRCDDDGNVLYALLNQDVTGFSPETIRSMSTHGVTFLLDVPCVANGERVFGQMVDLAQRFADVLRGALVDDNRRPRTEASLEPVSRQIRHYQAMLAERQLPAGSRLTQRLFS
jgi:FtsZ-interacting cell division protein ZipA